MPRTMPYAGCPICGKYSWTCTGQVRMSCAAAEQVAAESINAAKIGILGHVSARAGGYTDGVGLMSIPD